MARRVIGVVGLAVVLGAMTVGWGQPAGTRPAVGDLKIGLMDGSIVTGKLSVNELVIETKFGTLKVPVDQIQVLQPGLRSHPELQQKITDLIADLGADAFGDREKAQDGLVKMGPEIRGELEKQLKSAEGEKQTRLQKIIDDFQSGQDEDAPVAPWVVDDVIVTPGFTVVGRITTGNFSVTSSYGRLDLKLSDVRGAHRDAAGVDELNKTVAVQGNLAQSHGYVPSGLKLSKGDQVTITASGNVTLTPWGGNAISTPEGAANYGSMQPGNIPNGALIMRIGDGATPLKVGNKLTFTADRAGVLQLGIAMGSNFSGNEFPGEYSVKIHVQKK